MTRLGCVGLVPLAVAGGAALAQGAPSLAPPFPVFNQAYQETHEPDALASVLAEARRAYVLLDPFAEPPPEGWAAAVASLQANGNEVGAYVSIGTGEDWREDFAALRPHLVTTPWDQWGGEYFVTSVEGALPVMKARVDRVAAWGFDWVEFDNMDWAQDDEHRRAYGFTTTVEEAIAYYQALCDHAHGRGVRCMAKNVTAGADGFDGVLYESYPDGKGWWDQAGGVAFARAGKPVIIVHYGESDCAGVRDEYRATYGPTLSFLCEDANLGRYVRLAP